MQRIHSTEVKDTPSSADDTLSPVNTNRYTQLKDTLNPGRGYTKLSYNTKRRYTQPR